MNGFAECFQFRHLPLRMLYQNRFVRIAMMIWQPSSTLAWALQQQSRPLLLVRMIDNSGSVKLAWVLSAGVSTIGPYRAAHDAWSRFADAPLRLAHDAAVEDISKAREMSTPPKRADTPSSRFVLLRLQRQNIQDLQTRVRAVEGWYTCEIVFLNKCQELIAVL